MRLLSVLALLFLSAPNPLHAQNGGYWNYSATKIWKFSPQPGRTDQRVSQNITNQSIDWTEELYDAPNGRWNTIQLQFKWDMLDPNLQMVSILPRQAGATLQPLQKVRITGTLTAIIKYPLYGGGGASVYVGEPPIQNPDGWKSATELYPRWGSGPPAVWQSNVGFNTSANKYADFVTPEGPAPGTSQLTIRCTTGYGGSAAVEYIYDWVARTPSASRFGAVLGNTLNVREVAGGDVYDGTWTRRAGTDVFDAVWNGSVRDVIEIESVNGNRIVLYRHGNNGRYSGTLSADGSRVTAGTANWYAAGWFWSATVSGRSSR
jgi:hypothetical protein